MGVPLPWLCEGTLTKVSAARNRPTNTTRKCEDCIELSPALSQITWLQNNLKYSVQSRKLSHKYVATGCSLRTKSTCQNVATTSESEGRKRPNSAIILGTRSRTKRGLRRKRSNGGGGRRRRSRRRWRRRRWRRWRRRWRKTKNFSTVLPAGLDVSV